MNAMESFHYIILSTLLLILHLDCVMDVMEPHHTRLYHIVMGTLSRLLCACKEGGWCYRYEHIHMYLPAMDFLALTIWH